MTWKSLTADEQTLCQQMVLWIQTVREHGGGGFGYGPDWLPSWPDVVKSALFERIRSGKAPLPHPPPVGMSCPWYSLVEDAGPHVVGFTEDVRIGPHAEWLKDGEVYVQLSESFTIVEKRSGTDFIVKARRGPYQFRLWLDAHRWPEYRGGAVQQVSGVAWFMQNVEFMNDARPQAEPGEAGTSS